MRDEFYALREWDASTGCQRPETLEALGLADIATGDRSEAGIGR